LTVPFDITEPVVHDLVYGSPVSGGAQVDAPESTNWDCSIGDMRFIFGISDVNKFVRETAEFRRQRIDTEREPGEQSLDSGYWIRSQSSWHYGSGLSSAEPLETNADEARFRYFQSGGVDPWTPGELTLLNAASLTYAASATNMQVQGIATGVLFGESDGQLSYIPNTGAASAVSWGSGGNLNSFTDTGEVYIVSASAGIYKGTLPAASGALIYNKHYSTVRYNLVRWIKNRIMYAENQGIWEVTDLSPSSATIGTPFFEHPNTGWTWTDFADGPTAIYASGFSGENSSIFRIGVAATNTTVTLSQPVVVADMPRGENVLSMFSYVGSFLVVGTTSGVRVASISSDGSLSLGPLVIEGIVVDDSVGFGSYVYITARAKSNAGDRTERPGLYRIDLGQTLDGNPLKFAHAADLVTPTASNGSCTSVTVAGDDLWFAVTGSDATSGVYRQTETYTPEGWIETGRIRLGTIERKGWRDLRVLASPGTRGTITAYAATNDATAPSSWTELITVGAGADDRTGKLNSAAPAPESNLYVAFRLRSNTECGCPARMIGYQLRAVPAPERTRLLSVPILLFDFVTDRKGMRIGKPGFSWDTLQKLQDLESTAAVVQWRDFTTGEAATAYVERVSFTRVTPPSNRVQGQGGIATVLLRLV